MKAAQPSSFMHSVSNTSTCRRSSASPGCRGGRSSCRRSGISARACSFRCRSTSTICRGGRTGADLREALRAFYEGSRIRHGRGRQRGRQARAGGAQWDQPARSLRLGQRVAPPGRACRPSRQSRQRSLGRGGAEFAADAGSRLRGLTDWRQVIQHLNALFGIAKTTALNRALFPRTRASHNIRSALQEWTHGRYRDLEFSPAGAPRARRLRRDRRGHVDPDRQGRPPHPVARA